MFGGAFLENRTNLPSLENLELLLASEPRVARGEEAESKCQNDCLL